MLYASFRLPTMGLSGTVCSVQELPLILHTGMTFGHLEPHGRLFTHLPYRVPNMLGNKFVRIFRNGTRCTPTSTDTSPPHPQASRSQRCPPRKGPTRTTSPTRARVASTARRTSTPPWRRSPRRPGQSRGGAVAAAVAAAVVTLGAWQRGGVPALVARGRFRGVRDGWCCLTAPTRTTSAIQPGVTGGGAGATHCVFV